MRSSEPIWVWGNRDFLNNSAALSQAPWCLEMVQLSSRSVITKTHIERRFISLSHLNRGRGLCFWDAVRGSDVLRVERVRGNVKVLITPPRNCHCKTANQLSPKDLLYNPVPRFLKPNTESGSHTWTHTLVTRTQAYTPWGISTRHGNQEDLALRYSMSPPREIAL